MFVVNIHSFLVPGIVHHLFVHSIAIVLFFPDCSDGDVRLIGGNSSLSGRVEICQNNTQ